MRSESTPPPLFLPYSCPKFGKFLRPPCAGQIEEAKARRAKFHQALLGPQEHCLACKGENLVVLAGPEGGHTGPPLQEAVSHLKGKTDAAGGLQDPPIAPPGPVNLAEKEIKAPLPPKEEPGMAGVVKFKDEDEAKRFLGAGKIPAGPPPRCPRHPEEPQVACSPDSKRAGQYLGACKICMAERKVGRKGKDKMTPAVARDLGKVKGVMAAATKPSPPAAASPAKAEINVQPPP